MKGIAFAAALTIVAGCRTTKDVLDDCELNMLTGNYAAQTEEFLALSDEGGGDELMWRLHAAHTLHLTPSKEIEAIRQFDLAERVLQKNDQMSVFAQGGEGALAMMMNDKSFSYDGGGLDRIFTCVYRGVDFLGVGDVDNARVEFNRASTYQRNWLEDRKKEIAAAGEKMEEAAEEYSKSNKGADGADTSSSVSSAMADSSFAGLVKDKTGFDPSSPVKIDAIPEAAYINSYAAHLSAVFRWLDGDGADYEFNLLKRVAGGVPAAARDAAEYDAGRLPSGEVWIWVEDGLGPAREEWRLDLPVVLIPYANRYVLYAGMALPYLRERCVGAASWIVKCGGSVAGMDMLEDVDALAHTEYDVVMGGILTREITRTILRVGVQVALGIAAENSDDDNHKLILRISQGAAAAAAAGFTAADLRSWSTLPKRVFAARVKRPADGRIVIEADGRVAAEVVLPEGNSMVFVTKPSSQAPAAVKTATFPRR